MYTQAWNVLKGLPKLYGNFSKENPNLNAFILSVTSSVSASYIVASVIDDKANSLLSIRADEIKELKSKADADLIRFVEMKSAFEVSQAALHKCDKSLIDQSLKLSACKSDFKHSGVFYKVETFPEERASSYPAADN